MEHENLEPENDPSMKVCDSCGKRVDSRELTRITAAVGWEYEICRECNTPGEED